MLYLSNMYITSKVDLMNKHKLNKILRKLPDTFNFKAVFELDLKDKKNTQPHDTNIQKV